MNAVATLPISAARRADHAPACIPHPAARVAPPAVIPAAANETEAKDTPAHDEARQRAETRREQARALLLKVVPPLLGLALFVGVWALVSMNSPQLPSPVKTWASAVDVFGKPFYHKGPNDQGIGWNVLMSLSRVGIGFWVWDEWNNLNVQHILIAIFVIGIVGLLLEQLLITVAKRFSFDE